MIEMASSAFNVRDGDHASFFFTNVKLEVQSQLNSRILMIPHHQRSDHIETQPAALRKSETASPYARTHDDLQLHRC